LLKNLNFYREAPYNRTHWFDEFLNFCEVYSDEEIPNKSLILSSDDTFDYMLKTRTENARLDKTREELYEEFYHQRNITSMRDEINKLDLNDSESVKAFEYKKSIINGTVNQFIKRRVQNNLQEQSNGENMLRYFIKKMMKMLFIFWTNLKAVFLIRSRLNWLNTLETVQKAAVANS